MKNLLFTFCLSPIFLLNVNAQTYQVSTAAGNGTIGNINGTAASSQLNQPYGVKTDNDSVIYIADVQNHSIRKLNYNTNMVTLVAGTGSAGHQDGAGTSAKFNAPVGVFYSSGFLYVVEASSYIRKIDLNNNNTVSTVAGFGTGGFQNGAAATAKFNNPTSLWVDPNGDVYVTDYFNQCIRLISGGIVSTYAGTQGSAGLVNSTLLASKFNLPRDITKDSKGNFYIGELGNNVIRKISSGNVTTFAGNGTQASVDGNATTASFSHPGGICLTAEGYFYITDGTGNKIRKMDTLGNVTTIAGTGVAGFANGTGSVAQFNRPEALTYDVHGNLYIGDPDNERVRKITVPEVDCAPKENITGPGNVCSGNSAVLTANGSATSYTWSVNAGSVNTSTASVVPTGNTTYTLLSSGAAGCVGTATFTVAVVTTPSVAITGSISICSGTSTVLNGSGASTYTWSNNAGGGLTNSASISPSSTDTYTLSGTEASGLCSSSAVITVTVLPSPTVTVNSQTICVGASATLTATGASSYTWNPAPAFSNGSGSTVIDGPSQTTTYTITGASANNCTDSTTAALTVDSCTTKTNTLNSEELFVYPNPSSGTLIIKAPSDLSFADVELVNCIGETVMKTRLLGSVNKIDISQFNNGVYFISIRTPDTVLLRKIILQR